MRVPPISEDGYRYYGQWAGNQKGHRQVRSRCIAEVSDSTSFLSRQCGRHRGQGPNADYCKQHAKKVKP
jgi:hypothetical protein